MKVGELRIATPADFDEFRQFADSTEGWKERYNKNGIRTWTRPSDDSNIKVLKVVTVFENVEMDVMYDVLHDPLYRKVWDENMIEGYDLFHLDANNDVGYYSVKLPAPLKNRDFLNQRSWYANPEMEYIIMNHTVAHDECPPKKEFVRAVSIQTGYIVRKNPNGKGCQFTYISQTDPRGNIPKWLVNKGAESFAPDVMKKLREAGQNYPIWKTKNNPDNKPWIKFDPSKARVVQIADALANSHDLATALGAPDTTVFSPTPSDSSPSPSVLFSSSSTSSDAIEKSDLK